MRFHPLWPWTMAILAIVAPARAHASDQVFPWAL